MDLNRLLQHVVDTRASDLHLVAGIPPHLRIDGNLLPIPGEPILSPEDIEFLIKGILIGDNIQRIVTDKEIDFSIPFSDKVRFRVNAYNQKNTLAASFRTIPLEIPTIDSLQLPKILHSFTTLKQGLILVAGPTGHGKSTSLAAIINEINMTRSCHIVTIEDPIEFVFKSARSVVSQREMRIDTHSWDIALRSVLREDPDVVFIGEMRDFDTISAALTVAETGHLVFATLHTNSAAQTIDRIVDVFPEEQQAQIRMQLSNVIEAVFSQRLVPVIPKGRVVAYELMLGTSAIKNTIREGKTHQINGIIETSNEAGMITLDHSLAKLVREGQITLEAAQGWSLNPEELQRLVRS
jgi:twitching motility protein PilT